jgi:protein-S-isoprenylcysteine O-methyltransferase Ste14
MGLQVSGDFLFRWRGHLPLLLLPVMAVSIAVSQYPIRSRAIDLAWEIGCLVLALGAWAIRVYTVGVAAPGTSGRNTRRQKADYLNTTGPYSMVRHPLYLANSIIAFAFALFSHTWLMPPVILFVAPAFYARIARREEQYLHARFGARFDQWAARTPAMLPVPGRFVPAERPFDWGAVARRELYPLALILTMPMIIEVSEHLWETGRLTVEPVWLSLASAGAVTFLGLRYRRARRRAE